eukprot:358511_1
MEIHQSIFYQNTDSYHTRRVDSNAADPACSALPICVDYATYCESFVVGCSFYCHYVIQMYDAHPHNHTIDTRFIRTLYCPDPFLLVFLMLIASALLGINCLIMGGGTSCIFCVLRS